LVNGGGISQGMYVGIGTVGVPWFAGGKGGISVITGPTGGYIIGFIMAAFFLGYFMDRYIRARSFFCMLALMLFANFVLIHLPGLLQLNIWFSMKGSPLAIGRLLMLGTIPFIIGDVTKIMVAAAIINGISPKRAFNEEVDADKIKKRRIP
jgi:biotin transport system substrate-specific component